MDLQELRKSIDRTDKELLRLFAERMEVAEHIAEYKRQNNLPIFDPAREQQKLSELKPCEQRLFKTLFELSRERQAELGQGSNSGLRERILVINGPNMNMLGIRKPELYGGKTYADLVEFVHSVYADIDCVQSNHEGEIVELIQNARGSLQKYKGIVINPAAYTHTSVAIRDALEAVSGEVAAVEVHLTDISNREEFRKLSYVSDVCVKTFSGMGFEGYRLAIQFIVERKRCGLLGEKLSHSLSPMIHAELGEYEYRLYEKSSCELEAFLKHGDFDALNVTIPYKQSVIPYCSSLSETTKRIGSVNTITRSFDGSIHGDNTDYYGFEVLLRQTGVNPDGIKAVVLGSGGSSLTVQAVLRDLGADVVVISRSGADNYENIEKHYDAGLLINTTPVGMYPNNGASPLSSLSGFSQCRAVVDLVYNPICTELMFMAKGQGIPAFNGLAMLVAQAARFPFANPVNLSELVAKIESACRCIVLIGMPGCGKSSIAAELARLTKRKLIDTDALVTARAGKSILAIFTEDGEEAFRLLETEVLREVCKESGAVIATGGGVVTRPENERIIRQNAVVVFLDRDVAELPVTGRPVSERDGIAALAAKRLPLYRQWSDCSVAVCGVEHTAAAVISIIEAHGT